MLSLHVQCHPIGIVDLNCFNSRVFVSSLCSTQLYLSFSIVYYHVYQGSITITITWTGNSMDGILKGVQSRYKEICDCACLRGHPLIISVLQHVQKLLISTISHDIFHFIPICKLIFVK